MQNVMTPRGGHHLQMAMELLKGMLHPFEVPSLSCAEGLRMRNESY